MQIKTTLHIQIHQNLGRWNNTANRAGAKEIFQTEPTNSILLLWLNNRDVKDIYLLTLDTAPLFL